jgi:hypothetical protein
VPEIAVAAVLGLLAGCLAVLALRREGPRATTAVALVAAGSLAAAGSLFAAAATHRVPPSPPQSDDLPLRTAADGDATSRACRACHPDQHASWNASYHRTMTQPVSARSVLGDFRDAQVEFGGTRYRMFARGEQHFADVAPSDGSAPAQTVELEQITGSHHMQIYWVASGPGRRLESFPLVWLRGEERWIPRLAAFITPPSDESAIPSIWNNTCIGCHTTHPRPRITLDPPRADSQVTEFGIACEACHGSGSEHATAHRSPLHRYREHFSAQPDPSIVNPSQLTHVRSTQVCGQCHAVKTFYSDAQAMAWAENGPTFRPGDDLETAVNVISNATLSRPYTQDIMRLFPDFVSGSFWDDGIVRVVGREYNALLESGCYQRGELSCLSCHELHQQPDDARPVRTWADDQLDVGMDGDRACTQCHDQLADARRASEHSHHPPDSAGNACQNCHMPHTAYGLLKAVRAHEIHSPRVLTSGPGSARPNACNLCHLDRPLGWSADHLARWYGQPLPDLSHDDRRIAAGVRWAITGDAGVRALAAWSMGWGPAHEAAGSAWLVPYLVDLMDDPYDAVRMIASRSLAAVPGFAPGALDPLAQAPQRGDATRGLRDRAASFASAGGTPGEAALLDAQGRFVPDELARLRALRDDRPLNLAE